jgi:uncharacterized protein (TIRG00374 family)
MSRAAVGSDIASEEPRRGVPANDCFGRPVLAEGEEPRRAPEPVHPRRSLRRFVHEHRRLVALLVAALVITLFVVAVLPQITGIGTTLRKIGHGDKTWLVVGLVFEALSIGGYIALFRAMFTCQGARIGWRASYEITLAGVVATKLFAAAGAGGIALTAWALRSAGLDGRTIAKRMAGFEIILYALFMLALLFVGLALGTAVFGPHAPWTVSYLPAGFGAVVIVLALAAGRLPESLERRMTELAPTTRPRMRKLLGRLATVPAAMRDGMATSSGLLREANPGLLGAVAYWTFDIAALWASFRAFGAAPSIFAVIMGYYVGQLANAIPMPGGIGGVEGGMIGCFIALGVNGGAALIAVFAYRAISFWLPTIPGAIAYLQLRRRIAAWRDSAGVRAESAPG